MLETALGPLASAETRQRRRRAPKARQQALTLAADGAGIPAEMIMPAKLHAPTRRELLLGSGALFAWAFVPKIARAEGRDPRFLTIVLRGGARWACGRRAGRRSRLDQAARRQRAQA